MGEYAEYALERAFNRQTNLEDAFGLKTGDTWTTVGGHVLLIKNMDIEHIKNCISLCERRGNRAPSLMYERVADA